MKCRGIHFSSIYTRGSQNIRNIKCQEMSADLYQGITKLYAEKYCTDVKYKLLTGQETVSLKKIYELYKKIIPEPLRFSIKKMQNCNQNCSGNIATHYSKKRNNVIRYKIEIVAPKNEFQFFNLPVLMHETIHLLDFAFNPQYKSVITKVLQKKQYARLHKLYEQYYYTPEYFSTAKIKQVTKQFLKGMCSEDKLLLLKYIKLGLATENRAYKISDFYKRKLKINNMTLECDVFKFKRKMKLVDKMRYKIIKKERTKIKKELAQTKTQ